MYSKIINPKTGRAVNVNGRIGKQILKNYIDVMNGGEGKFWKILDLNTNASQEIGINRLTSIGREKRLYRMSENQLLEKRIKWINDGTGHTNGLKMLDNIWIDRFAENNTYYKQYMHPHLHCGVDEDTVLRGLSSIGGPLEAVRKELKKDNKRIENKQKKIENKIKIQQISILLNRLKKLKDKWAYNNGSIC